MTMELVRSIKKAKAAVRAMLIERGEVAHADAATMGASRLWSETCANFAYMLDLPEEHFAKIRLHTHHFTGDMYQRYDFVDPAIFVAMSGIQGLTANLPEDLILNEPAGGLGFALTPDRFVSWDIIRFQRVVRTLYREGEVTALRATARKGRCSIVEIGGGYGGLAHHLSRIVGNTTYVIVDLPETLLFSAAYLAMHNPEKRLLIYEPNCGLEAILKRGLGDYDFVLLPNYRLAALEALSFDFAINVASFTEMTPQQLVRYLGWLSKMCRGRLYSYNMEFIASNPRPKTTTEYLEEFFTPVEILDGPEQRTAADVLRSGLRAVARRLGLLGSQVHYQGAYREYLCVARR